MTGVAQGYEVVKGILVYDAVRCEIPWGLADV